MSAADKQRASISVGGLAFVDAGDPSAPPVLLLHGFPTSSHLWRGLVPLLAPAMRVIAPDLLGAGDSDRPAEVPLGLAAHVGYVRELLDTLGVERCAVVGHGFGGGIAQLLALEGRAQALVLVDSIVSDAWPSEPTAEVQAVEHLSPELAAVLRAAFDLGMGKRWRLSDEALERYLTSYSGEDGAAAFLRQARAIDGRGLREREAELSALEVPALILWGEDDPFLPVELAERLNDLLPASSLALLPGCSHFLPEDAPETIGPLVYEYLRGRYLGRSHAHETGPVPVQLGRRSPEDER